MIQKDNNGSKKIKENKYKILRMSLLLGQDSDREETINNFCDAAREIDSMNNETYLEELESKFYNTETLEEESKKLTELVDYIAGRISQRESLISDFINVTGKTLNGLGEIKYGNRLFEYQERLKYINEYLDNSKKIAEETEELEKLRTRLKEEEYQKGENENKNAELENLLRKKFATIVANKIELESLNEENIDDKISDLHFQTEESKKSLDIFTKSFETLKNAGISYEDEVEYRSYVTGARDIYYDNKEEEYLLNVYKLLLTTETEYSKIFNKRECINNILNERLELRANLAIKDEDNLSNIYNILSHQTQIVEGQKENIDNIINLTAKIKYIEERIAELNEENEKVEILALLKEYNIIDTYEEETTEIEIPIEDEKNEEELEKMSKELEFPELELSMPLENEENNELEISQTNLEIEETESQIEDNKVEEEKVEKVEELEEDEDKIELPINKPYKNNFVMGIHEPTGLNVDDCIEKATNVMKRVGKMLNIEIEEEKKEAPSINKSEIQPEPKKVEEPATTENPFIEPKEITEPTTQPTTSPFIEPVIPNIKSPFIEEPQNANIVPEKEEKQEESNIKNVLPPADNFWDNDAPTANDLENGDFPELTVSNDDFFANNMDNFEFPNLDEFK